MANREAKTVTLTEDHEHLKAGHICVVQFVDEDDRMVRTWSGVMETTDVPMSKTKEFSS